MKTQNLWIWRKRHRCKAVFLLVHVMFNTFLPSHAFNISPVVFQQYQQSNRNCTECKIFNGKKFPGYNSDLSNFLPIKKFPNKKFITKNNFYKQKHVENFLPAYVRQNQYYGKKKKYHQHPSKKQDMAMCDGKSNFLQDLSVLAVVTGFIGTALSIFTASYFSIISNDISIVTGWLSYITGIPSAILTFLAASDTTSYVVGNVLSVLSLLNTAVSFWSIDYGNWDILISHVANGLGVFSLILSIATTFPDIFDSVLRDISSANYEVKEAVNNFVDNYGCEDGDMTAYEYFQDFIRLFIRM